MTQNYSTNLQLRALESLLYAAERWLSTKDYPLDVHAIESAIRNLADSFPDRSALRNRAHDTANRLCDSRRLHTT